MVGGAVLSLSMTDKLLAAWKTIIGCGDGGWCRNPLVISCLELPAAYRPMMVYGEGEWCGDPLSSAVGSFQLHVGP